MNLYQVRQLFLKVEGGGVLLKIVLPFLVITANKRLVYCDKRKVDTPSK